MITLKDDYILENTKIHTLDFITWRYYSLSAPQLCPVKYSTESTFVDFIYKYPSKYIDLGIKLF